MYLFSTLQRSVKAIPPHTFILLIGIIALLPFATGLLPTVRFTSEQIHVDVHPDEITVEGSYIYKNPFPLPVVQGFYIPFPVDHNHPEPYQVHVERVKPVRETLRLRHSFGKTRFETVFSAQEETEIRVSYRQKALASNATYILTTTSPWGRPLDSGVYTLSTHGTVILSSNYPFNLPDGRPGFQKSGFMPDKEWQFTWRKKS